MFNSKSTNEGGGSMELIPAGTLAEVVIIVREIKTSSSTGGRYLDLELAIQGGNYHNRRIFSVIVDPWDSRSSDGGKKMSIGSITRIFESAGIFIAGNEASYAVFPTEDDVPGENIRKVAMMMQGKKVGIAIGIQKGKDGYADKNSVKEWLSPNPESGGFRGWQRLQNGETGGTAVQSSLQSTPQPAFGAAPAGVFGAPAATQAQTGFQTPSFLKR